MTLMTMRRLDEFGKLVLSLTVVFFFVGCNKAGDLVFIIEGEIFDKSFNEKLQNGTVQLFRVPTATTQEILIATQNVSNGKYSFTFPRDMSERYILRFSKDNYFDEVHEVHFSQLEVGKAYKLNFIAEAIAMMNWVLVDQNPSNPNNSVIVQKLSGRIIGQGVCPNQQYEFFGGAQSDTLRCAVGGNQFVKFYTLQLPDFTLDSVYCPAFQNVYYTVNF